MIINKLKLTNFRSYKNLELEFGNNINIFVGRNAEGKTNIVESLYILSTLKSFRNSKLIDCIKEGENFAKIEISATFENVGLKTISYIINSTGENEYYVNNNKITKKSEILGNVFAIVFSPDELKIVKGSPDIRRDFLDTDISEVSKSYSTLLDRYEIILSSRNKTLKFSKNSSTINTQLDIWDEQLSIIGGQICFARQRFIEKINSISSKIMNELTEGKENLIIEYIGPTAENRQEISGYILKELLKAREKDLELGYTTVGPHRDDIKFIVNEREVKPFASQGQQRLVVLAVKLAEIETMKNEKETPILILDDVFSELDKKRQNTLQNFLTGEQVFITGTSVKYVGILPFKKFRVVNSQVKQLNVKIGKKKT